MRRLATDDDQGVAGQLLLQPGDDVLAVEVRVHEQVQVLPGDIHAQLALELLQGVLLVFGSVIQLLDEENRLIMLGLTTK